MFGYYYDVMESKGQKSRLRPHKGQKTVTCPRAIFKQNATRRVKSEKKSEKNVHGVCWRFLKLWIPGFQMRPKSKSCACHDSRNLPYNICVLVYYYQYNRGSLWRGFLQLFVDQLGLYICWDSLEQSFIKALIINVKKHVLITAQNPAETWL